MATALFVASMVGSIICLFKLFSIMAGHNIDFPWGLDSIWVMLPSFSYQIWFWTDMFSAALGLA